MPIITIIRCHFDGYIMQGIGLAFNH